MHLAGLQLAEQCLQLEHGRWPCPPQLSSAVVTAAFVDLSGVANRKVNRRGHSVAATTSTVSARWSDTNQEAAATVTRKATAIGKFKCSSYAGEERLKHIYKQRNPANRNSDSSHRQHKTRGCAKNSQGDQNASTHNTANDSIDSRDSNHTNDSFNTSIAITSGSRNCNAHYHIQ